MRAGQHISCALVGALWDELSRYMDREHITQAELGRLTDVSHSQISRLKKGENVSADPDTLRKLARGTGIPLTQLIVASGMFSADDLQVKVVRGRPQDLTNEELLAVIKERLREPTTTERPLADYEPAPQVQEGEPKLTGRSRPRLVVEHNNDAPH